MKIHLSSFGEGHDPDQLTALMKEIELLAMRAGYPFVFVSGETETLNLILGSDSKHTRDEWKKQWAAGTTDLGYPDWGKEECARTCGGGDEDKAQAQWTAALMEMYSAYVNSVAPDDDSLMLFKEWKEKLLDDLGFSPKLPQISSSNLSDVFRSIFDGVGKQGEALREIATRDVILTHYLGDQDDAGYLSLSEFIQHQLDTNTGEEPEKAYAVPVTESAEETLRHYRNYLNRTTDHPPLSFPAWQKDGQPSS